MADSVTQVRVAGPVGAKKNLAILGDGFAAGNQNAYNTWVNDVLLGSVFGQDYFYEDASAWNIFRVNLESNDSGVTRRVYDEHGTPADPSDDTITSTTARDTALDIIYSGSWSHCWLEYGPNTETRLQAALTTWVPDYDFVLIVLNEPGFGGCGGGGRAHVTLGSDWTVIAHEFGHGLGGLADEYCVAGAYTGGEPGVVNLTVNTDRATTKWGNFIAPDTPVPTGTGDCAGYTAGTRPHGGTTTRMSGCSRAVART
ncbi:MAG TPA: M64 family metallopeptidase [Pseudonocardiaceae bacterium]|nr:M64 family metallopeptidase [Pseudonocardiaceae bacterium]